MGAEEVRRFLTSLAVDRKVAASTQNQALSALLFLYRDVLQQTMPWVDDVVRARSPHRLPVVLTRDEVRVMTQRLHGVTRLMAVLMYGAGLRLLECTRLRVKDVDFASNQITVRGGKGGKDRITMLPAAVKPELKRHLERMRSQHTADLERGTGWVELPDALARKYPNAGITFTSQSFSGLSRRPFVLRGSPSAPVATRSATPSPRTSWRTGTIFAPSRSSSATGMSPRP